jgi:hypothetical protein
LPLSRHFVAPALRRHSEARTPKNLLFLLSDRFRVGADKSGYRNRTLLLSVMNIKAKGVLGDEYALAADDVKNL